jgi:ornithine cyclodeaminase/alanine dehydrogenase-like protein (mu-crystallin family)
VRTVERVLVYSPREARREAFAEEIRGEYGIEATPVDRPDAAVADADIAIVATNTLNAPDPIAFRGEWMRPGMHVSSIGATMPILRELDVESFARAGRLVVDAPASMEEECGDVIAAVEAGVYGEQIALSAVAAGDAAGRESDDQITLFKSVGTAMQDVIAALAVYETLEARGGAPSFDLLHLKAFEKPMNLVKATQQAPR